MKRWVQDIFGLICLFAKLHEPFAARVPPQEAYLFTVDGKIKLINQKTMKYYFCSRSKWNYFALIAFTLLNLLFNDSAKFGFNILSSLSENGINGNYNNTKVIR